jgi:Predicted membrane protein (DUF2207)
MSLWLAIATPVAAGVWLLGAGVAHLRRRPPSPPPGAKTLELGQETPAVASFLVNRFRVPEEALPATLLDLAARDVVEIEQRGPGVFFVRLPAAAADPSNPYERRVLDHLRRRASDGVVPAEALTSGPETESGRWRRAFASEVVADAKAQGLSRDALDGQIFTVLTAAALVPGLLAWATWEFEAGLIVFFGAVALLGWIQARHPQRETPAGMQAASRWLGVRAALAENEAFDSHSPLTVEVWDRLLAYGAALGVASAASRPLPMGVEPDTRAWSAYGGRWRPVRIEYPRYWPPGWGRDPSIVLALGLAVAGGAGLVLYLVGASLVDAGILALVPLAALGGGVVVGVATAIVAAGDWGTGVEVTGPILRLRRFGDDDDRRHYAAVDDGASDAIRAFRVGARHFAGLEQGRLVTVRTSRSLGCVRWIIPAEASGAAL